MDRPDDSCSQRRLRSYQLPVAVKCRRYNGWANATGTGATTATYTPSSASAGTTYYRVLINAANSGCGQAVSNNATAIITEDLVVTTQPTNVNECVGGLDQMTVVVSGGSGAISYQWQSSADGINGWANATGTGATTATYTPSSASAGTTYYRVLINAANQWLRPGSK